jgi:hypothetical protein
VTGSIRARRSDFIHPVTQLATNRMFGRHERTFNLVNGPMVHLTSQTAIVDDAGKLALRDEVYGFDAH